MGQVKILKISYGRILFGGNVLVLLERIRTRRAAFCDFFFFNRPLTTDNYVHTPRKFITPIRLFRELIPHGDNK